MTGPKRIQLSRAKGWRLPPGAVNVARPSRWGNPYRVGDDGVPDQAEAVRLHREWIERRRLTAPVLMHAELDLLRGRDLACWCKPGTPCHADTLIKFANQGPES